MHKTEGLQVKVGARVKLKNHPNEVTGAVIRIAHQGLWAAGVEEEYLVRYDEDGLFPAEDWHKADQLDFLDMTTESNKKCTCGVHSILPNADISFHSDYCDLK